MRYAAKRDANEADIRDAFHARNARTWPVSDGGRPDLVVLHVGRWYLVEVKVPGGRLTRAQVEFIEQVERDGGKVYVVTTEAEVDEIVRGWANGNA